MPKLSTDFSGIRRRFNWGLVIILISVFFFADLSAAKIRKLRSPVRIAKGSQKLIYVTDFNGKRVVIYKWNRFKLKPWRQFRLKGFPLGLAVFNDKYIFVGNSSKNRVMVYDLKGERLYRFKQKSIKPNDIVVSKRKVVYVVASNEHLVKVYNFRGHLQFSFGGQGSAVGQFNFPTGISIDQKNREIVVGDFLNKRVQVFDMNGNWLKSFGGGMFMSIVDRPQGIAVDGAGNYHIVDSQQACVHVFNNQGNRTGSYGEYGKGPGQLRTPLDIVLDSVGNALVTSNRNRNIEIFKGVAK